MVPEGTFGEEVGKLPREYLEAYERNLQRAIGFTRWNRTKREKDSGSLA